MNPSGGPNMSVLDRVKMFLPQIEKANADLEKEINLHGNDRFLIDKDLAAQVRKSPIIIETDMKSSATEISEGTGINRGAIEENLDENDTDDEISNNQEIELNFALGDFNETALAQAEEELRIEEDKGREEADEDDDGNQG